MPYGNTLTYLFLEKFYQKLKKLSRAYINQSVFGKILSKIEKIVKTFQFPIKVFLKIVYYCVLCTLRAHVNKTDYI